MLREDTVEDQELMQNTTPWSIVALISEVITKVTKTIMMSN